MEPCPPIPYLPVAKSAISVQDDPFQCSVFPVLAEAGFEYPEHSNPSVLVPDLLATLPLGVFTSATSVQEVPSQSSTKPDADGDGL